MINNSVMKCCICNNEKMGEFITINVKKYHLCCIEDLKQDNELLKRNCNIGNENLVFFRQQNKELHNKIDKAIEYIKELYDNTDDITCYEIDRNTRDDLLEILKDSDVDEL